MIDIILPFGQAFGLPTLGDDSAKRDRVLARNVAPFDDAPTGSGDRGGNPFGSGFGFVSSTSAFFIQGSEES
jgi:hypothetical protein